MQQNANEPWLKAYEGRMDALRGARASAKSDILQTCYSDAIDATEEALLTLADLNAAVEAKFHEDKAILNELQAWYSANLARIGTELQAARDRLESAEDDLQRTAAHSKARMIHIDIDMAEISMANINITGTISLMRLEVFPRLVKQLFDRIISPNESQFQWQAAVDGIHFALGMAPVVGSVYSAILAIHGIATKRKAALGDADRHLVYLQDYREALKHWIAAAQATMRTFELVDDA